MRQYALKASHHAYAPSLEKFLFFFYMFLTLRRTECRASHFEVLVTPFVLNTLLCSFARQVQLCHFSARTEPHDRRHTY